MKAGCHLNVIATMNQAGPGKQKKENAMDVPHRPPTREQRIFNLGLEVEAVSLYLLCCGLVDAGQRLSLATITPAWNLDRPALIANLEVLVKYGILAADGEVAAETTRFHLRAGTSWHPPEERHQGGR
jgi:hypothetical protein